MSRLHWLSNYQKPKYNSKLHCFSRLQGLKILSSKFPAIFLPFLMRIRFIKTGLPCRENEPRALSEQMVFSSHDRKHFRIDPFFSCFTYLKSKCLWDLRNPLLREDKKLWWPEFSVAEMRWNDGSGNQGIAFLSVIVEEYRLVFEH